MLLARALFLVTFLCLVWDLPALEVNEVALFQNDQYLPLRSAPGPRLLECRYTLSPAEEAKSVEWFKDGQLVFTWTAGQGATVNGSLSDAEVETQRKDGHLQFKDLRMDFAGIYSCTVTLETGERSASNDYQLLIVDVAEGGVKMTDSLEDCVIKVSFQTPAIDPMPTVVCGAWRTDGKYIFTVSGWEGTPLGKGRFEYQLKNGEFWIRQMPLNSVVKCQVGITKVDDSFVPLFEENRNYTEISERGCRRLDVNDSTEVQYSNHKMSCRNELLAADMNSPATARVSCKEGFLSNLQRSSGETLNYACYNFQWNVDKGTTWKDADNFQCVKSSAAKANLFYGILLVVFVNM